MTASATFSHDELMPPSEVAALPERIPARELDRLYRSLDPDQKDELLQCLLVAASGGSGAMEAVLEQTLLVFSVQEVLRTCVEVEPDDNES